MRKLVVTLLAAPALTLGLLAPTAATAAPAPAGAPVAQSGVAAPTAVSAERRAKKKLHKKKAHKKKAGKRKGAMKGKRLGLSRRDMRVWNRLAHCESTGRWWVNTGNGYYGGLQIHPGTWAAYGGKRFASNAHRASKFQQVRVGQRIRQGQGWGAWPHCSRRIGVR